jgi:hypothetical protein
MFDAYEKSIMDSLGQVEANTEKIDPGMMQPMEEHQGILKEDAVVMPVGEPRKQHRVWKLAAKHRQKIKDRTRAIHGYRKKVSRHATVAWRKRNITRRIRIQVKSKSSNDFAANGMRKGPRCKNGIRH